MQAILSLCQNYSSEGGGKYCLPRLQQNPEFCCQHLHPSAIRINVEILEIIITIIKTQQTVPTHKKSVWSSVLCPLNQYYSQNNVGLIFFSSLRACMYGILYKLWFVVILVTLCYVTGKIMIAHRPGLLSFFWMNAHFFFPFFFSCLI